MLRSVRSLTIAPRLPLAARVPSRCLSSTRANNSIMDTAKDMLDKANKKTGEVLASTIENTEKVATNPEQMKEAATDAASTVNQKTGKVLADGIEKAEEAAGKAKEVTKEAKAEAEAKHKVLKNTSGYEDLQDKGKKVESEQNRPDDAV